MRPKLIFVLFFLVCNNISAQLDVAAGMGLTYFNSPSLNDYFITQGKELPAFSSSGGYFVEVSYPISSNLQIGVEYDVVFFSQGLPLSTSAKIDFTHYRPSIIGYYVIQDLGYKFKFGGGIGYRHVSLDQSIVVVQNYKASGFGLAAKAQGNTLLSSDLYASIGIDIRYDHPGELKSDTGGLYNRLSQENVNLNSISFSFKLGLSYFL